MNKNTIYQLLKYGIVGVMNTLLTAVVIWTVLKFGFGVVSEDKATSIQMVVSNFAGYAVGLINSFIFNRNWTFKSRSDWKTGFLKFVLAFGFCYALQLGAVLALNEYVSIPTFDFNALGANYIVTSSYICQLIGIVFYTGLNFFCNKYYTFKK
ncbi:MAG: GtrA family protein [Dysgonamonadaceae bacterium]|jgi:putative flippase GtrA|nr:GtrA family protein [Dysgonamonadaceae bacterium]